MSKKMQIILIFSLVLLFCLTSCAGILNELFGLESTNPLDAIFDSFVVYRINDSYSYIDFTVPEEITDSVGISVYQVKSYSDEPRYSNVGTTASVYKEDSYYDGWTIRYEDNYSEVITPSEYKKINSLTYSYNSYKKETTFSWDLGEFPSISEGFAISNYEYSKSYSLYSILIDSIDSSLNSISLSGDYTNENYYFYFEYDDGYYYCLGKFERN